MGTGGPRSTLGVTVFSLNKVCRAEAGLQAPGGGGADKAGDGGQPAAAAGERAGPPIPRCPSIHFSGAAGPINGAFEDSCSADIGSLPAAPTRPLDSES